jgi:peptidyl-prolyl cis-trans isomerase SurA
LKENKHFAHISLNSTAKKSLELLYNKESTLTLQVLEGLFEKGDNELLDKIQWSEGDTTFSDGKTSYLIYIKKIVAPENKTFEETKGLIISDYQNQLEKDWIQELKKKFTVEKDDIVFKKVKQYFKSKRTSDD